MKINLNLLKSKPEFTRILCALFVSGLGTSFTSVAVYQEMSRVHSGSFAFSLAFAAAMIPGFITSYAPGRTAKRVNVGYLLWIGQIAGLLSLAVPVLGYHDGAIGWLIVAEALASAITGFLVPIYKGIERASFREEEFQQLAALDTLVLTANFILGQGLGALIALSLSLRAFIAVDALTYVVALWILFPVRNSISMPFSDNQLFENQPAAPVRLSKHQKRALFTLPWLALTCAPPMIILPSRASEWDLSILLFNGLRLAPVMLLVCSRTLGQILGPLIAGRLNIESMANKSWTLAFSLASYLVLYSFAYISRSLSLVAMATVLAHLFSNVVYTVGNFQVLRAFGPHETIWATGWIYRYMTLITGVSGLVVGFLADHFGRFFILGFSATALIAGATLAKTFEVTYRKYRVYESDR